MNSRHDHIVAAWLAVTLLVATSSFALADTDETPGAAGDRIETDDARVSLIQNTFIAAPIAGIVAKVHVAEGDQILSGAPMVQLDTEQATTELVAAQAAYEAARLKSDNDVDARYAKRTLDVRIRELEQSLQANRSFSGAVSQTEIERLKLVVDQSKLGIEQAEHELNVARAGAEEKYAAVRMAETKLRRHGITATVGGSVVEVAIEPGEWVDAGKPIVRLVSLDPIRVEFFVDGHLYGPELVNRKVEFYPVVKSAGDADTESTLLGRVTFVSPELDSVTGQARAWATIANPKQLVRAGMRGRLVVLPPVVKSDSQ